jgi:hypothetical protein
MDALLGSDGAADEQTLECCTQKSFSLN